MERCVVKSADRFESGDSYASGNLSLSDCRVANSENVVRSSLLRSVCDCDNSHVE